ncbi:hypothetical protein, partial [Pseudomonas sp. FSL A6-1183]|uniref:hypothetical protein n=1 Tax=Pseudomonas sp. FSL A6-1183 TaxID=2662191 RepID=UPI001C49AC89
GFVANNGNQDAPRAGMYKISQTAIVDPARLLCSPLNAARAKAVTVLNPVTGKYSTAVAEPKQSLTVNDKKSAEVVLGRLGSLFGEDE